MNRVIAIVVVFIATALPASAQDSRGQGTVISTGASGIPGVAASAEVIRDQSSGSGSSSRPSHPVDSRASGAPDAVRILPLSCLGSDAASDGIVVSLNRNSCVAAATRPARTPDPGAPLPSPVELAWIAADRAMSFAEWPQLRVAPRHVGLTGLRSFFWLDHRPRPVTASASVPGMVVTAYAEPVRFAWDLGEGPARTTRHIGRAWTRRRPGNIAHLHERRGPRTISVEVLWEARWRINSGAWQHLGYFSNADSRPYRVRQMVAMLSRTRRR